MLKKISDSLYASTEEYLRTVIPKWLTYMPNWLIRRCVIVEQTPVEFKADRNSCYASYKIRVKFIWDKK